MRISVKIACAAIIAMGSIGAIETASAMPMAQQSGAAPLVEQAGWRCGPGWHATPWGRCVPNRPWRRGPGWGWRRRW